MKRGKKIHKRKISSDGRIVASVTEVEDVGEKKVVFSFSRYNIGQCEIHNLDKTESKQLLDKLREISNMTVMQFNRSYIRDVVKRGGDYAGLFDTVPEDSGTLLEIKYSKTGRMFGYLVQHVFGVVAVCKRHK